MTSHLSDYSEVVRVPLPKDDELSDESRKLVQRASDLNVARMFAGTEEMFAPTAGLIKAVFEAEGISPKTRQMIVCAVPKKLRCPYEWQANLLMAKNAGLTSAEIKATESGTAVEGIDEEYVLVCRATDELIDLGTLHDDTLAELQERYGDTHCRKIILIISWFNMLSRFLNGCRVPLETADKIGSRISPLG